jgi:hypothetical protein
MTIILTAEYTFTRPNDTTAYAANDQVNNSTTAASVVPMSWTDAIPFTGGVVPPYRFIGAKIRKTGLGVVNPSFRLHLYSAIPTIATTGDNASFNLVTGRANWLATLSATHLVPHADGCVAHAVPSENGAYPIWQAGGGTARFTVYGMLEAAAAYTPTAQEVFGVRLLIEV